MVLRESRCGPRGRVEVPVRCLHRTEYQNHRHHLAGKNYADKFPGFIVLESLESCEHLRNVETLDFPYVCRL